MCVLLGVSDESKGYRLFDPIAKKIMVSKDVIFKEEEKWKWDEDTVQGPVVDLEWGDQNGEEEEEDKNREGINGEPSDVREISQNDVDGDLNLSAEGRRPVEDETVRNGVETGREERVARQARERQPPIWLGDYFSGEDLQEDETEMAFAVSTNPWLYEEAIKNCNWRMAMNSEIESIEKNNTWTLTDLPAGAKKIRVKWVYKTKYSENGKIDKYKACLVAKGYSQKYGVDYTEVFAPVARMDTVRMNIALAAHKN